MIKQRKRRGGAMVESALALIILFMLLLGTIEFGRAVWVYNTLAYAARQGMRYAIVRGSVTPATNQDIESVVRANAIGLNTGSMTVVTSWSPNRQRGSTVLVRVDYPFQFAVSPALAGAATINMRSNSTGIVAQ